ncbi:hypothetical protein BC831DRAFT_247802 [Entophlyctis helioformis]|nr:hypothetical protein BC831DRAFT_247802 [Entophlyctis helioformis]
MDRGVVVPARRNDRGMFNSPFGTTLLPQSPSLVNAAVFAVMRSSTGESTELLESLLRQVPRVRESLTDLHHFAIRLGKIAYVRLLVGGWPQYTLGPRIIALLNHAYQNEDEDIVQYLLDYTGLSPNVATIVAAWKALHDVEAAAEEPVVSETLHTYVVTSVQTCLRKAVLDKNGGDGQQGGPETLLAPPQSQSIRRMYWTSLVEMACSKGMTELVRQLLDVSRDAEFRSLNLRTTVKMLALAVDGNFADMADMLVDSITGDPMPVFEGSDPSAGFQARLMLQPSPLGMSGVSHAAAQSTASMDPEASISRTGMALFSGLPSNAVERCEELLYRYCSLPNSALFVALFPFYQLSELPDWAEAIKVHRIDTISYLIESGTRRAATQGGGSSVFHIRDDCIWAAFQAGNVEIAQILQSAGGNVGWMESTGVAAPQLSGIAASWNGIGKPSQGAPVALSRQGTDDNGHMDAMGFDSFRLCRPARPWPRGGCPTRPWRCSVPMAVAPSRFQARAPSAARATQRASAVLAAAVAGRAGQTPDRPTRVSASCCAWRTRAMRRATRRRSNNCASLRSRAATSSRTRRRAGTAHRVHRHGRRR